MIQRKEPANAPRELTSDDGRPDSELQEAMAMSNAPQTGRIDFDNGDIIVVDFVEDGWVFYRTWYSENEFKGLFRKKIEDWHISLAATREKIANASGQLPIGAA